MKFVYVRDCDRNPFGCIVESDGIYGYSICHPGEVFQKAKAREIAIGRMHVKAMSRQDVVNAVPKYLREVFDRVIGDMENFKNTRKDTQFSEFKVSASTTEHWSKVCDEPLEVQVRKTISKKADKGLIAMVKGFFSL